MTDSLGRGETAAPRFAEGVLSMRRGLSACGLRWGSLGAACRECRVPLHSLPHVGLARVLPLLRPGFCFKPFLKAGSESILEVHWVSGGALGQRQTPVLSIIASIH